MASENPCRETPKACPYCNQSIEKLPVHLPCDAVPSTDEVIDAKDAAGRQ